MIDITRTLEALAKDRPMFHSEADFQHALAWKIHQQWPTCSIRFECKTPYLDDRSHLDIWAFNDSATLVIELKYKTRALHADVDGETFDLKDQSAEDSGRYDFLKDIRRLEQIVSRCSDIVGYAILLTNDSLYWKPPTKNKPIDTMFRIDEGKKISGKLSWRGEPSEKTIQDREEPIVIRHTYWLSWRDYSEPIEAPYGRFRYLLVRVDSGHGA